MGSVGPRQHIDYSTHVFTTPTSENVCEEQLDLGAHPVGALHTRVGYQL